MAKNKYLFPLLVMAFLFFMFGFITVMNNSSIQFLTKAFGLNNVQKQLPNTFFYGAYVLSIPIGLLIKRIGYRHTIFFGLGLIALGFFACVPALNFGYSPFLATLSLFAIGVVIVQVSTTPYIVALGEPETAASRLTFANAMNSVATVIAPIFVSILFTTPNISDGEILTNFAIQHVLKWPFLGVGITVAIILAVLLFIKLPAIHSQQIKEASNTSKYKSSAFKYKHVWLGSLAIFAYLGAEIGIPSFFADFVASRDLNLSLNTTDMLKYYWAGLLIGRLAGMVALQKIRPTIVLVISTLGATIMLTLAIFSTGILGVWLYLGVGLFHSVMFPVVNSLALKDLGPHSEVASGIITTSVIGAAILMPVMGGIQDRTGTVVAAISCLFLYHAYIAFYGIKGAKLR